MTQEKRPADLPSAIFTSPYDVTGTMSGRNVLGVVNFTTGCTGPRVEDSRLTVDLHMAHRADEEFSEVWTTDRPVETGVHRQAAYAHDGEYLLIAGRIPPAGRYAEGTSAAYCAALELMEGLGYKNCFRMWNFVGGINGDNADGLEIYRDFCKGRAEAFELFRFGDLQVPSATGIGSLGGGIAFYFLAGRSAALTSIENSKQVSAYHYPEQYGPRPPKFARATYLSATHTDRTGGQLYVAGTASIRGHETCHEGDLVKQMELSLENISHLISRDNLDAYEVDRDAGLRDLDNIKVYVRRSEDVPTVRRICSEHFSPAASVAYLNVDICRSGLLVEIEGIVF
ncbi:FkbO/Hyg5 family chorismatase [Streptomyces pacificus]|uniref:Chorismatase FkbO/Hyg5-like N-terminal domain-containing protein n=1 Tax=Streptomyces pacificus TaxID=2705029 RepID=A0A6A0B4R3_9ACTN|nr:FkbO/Hyg5 family chorismatase [Streptomyces pacificus]GFH39488.1 hypothetical protein SCWH03_57560 [Streptomyces pacificus]